MFRSFANEPEAAASGDRFTPPNITQVATPGRRVLHLGVIEVPYVEAPEVKKIPRAKKGKANKPLKASPELNMVTTVDVAQWLEKKYDVMQTFADQQEPAIAHVIEASLAGTLESIMMGAPANINAFGTAENEIGQMFRTFLDEEEVAAAGVPGTPTAAALAGVNHRLKSKRGAPRPSFIDTGLYQASFRAWVD